VQQVCKSCRTCFKFYCMFYFTCDRSFSPGSLRTLRLPSTKLTYRPLPRKCETHITSVYPLKMARHLKEERRPWMRADMMWWKSSCERVAWTGADCYQWCGRPVKTSLVVYECRWLLQPILIPIALDVNSFYMISAKYTASINSRAGLRYCGALSTW